MVIARKKPVEIEALQWNGHNFVAIDNFITVPHETYPADGIINIPTLEGTMTASLGDWIIKGVNGEFYPCKPDIFEKTYDIVKGPMQCCFIGCDKDATHVIDYDVFDHHTLSCSEHIEDLKDDRFPGNTIPIEEWD